jgi:hypothetical protein
VLSSTVGIVALYYCKYLSMSSEQSFSLSNIMSDVGTFCFITCIIAFFSPLLRSLSIEYAENTLMLCVVLLIGFHVITYEYQQFSTKSEFKGTVTKITNPFSLNAIFLASVLLSSRCTHEKNSFVILF